MSDMIIAGNRGLVLQNISDLERWSKLVARSNDMCPAGFRGKPEAVAIAIQQGAELGLSPMKSLQSIAVINGRATLWGDTALGLVRASGLCDYVKEWIEGDGDKMTAYCESKRKDSTEPVLSCFSVENAKQAKLWDKAGTWKQYPERMLKYRARGFNLRDNFPDVLCGFHITEEMSFPDPAYEPTTPKRAERKQVESVEIDDTKKERIEACMTKFSMLSEQEGNIYSPEELAQYFKEYIAKRAGVDINTLATPEGFTDDVLMRTEASLEEWENAGN